MKVLVLNCGSSSLKYQLFDMTTESVMAKGLVEKIGLEQSDLTHKVGDQKVEIHAVMPNHSKAIELVIGCLTSPEHGVIKDMKEIDAVGHRIVHGGSTFAQSVLLQDEVIAEVEKLVEIAPLHNPPALLGINACKETMPGVPMVGVFDTSFHQTMPASSYIYGIGYDMYEKYGVRRYGFHGTSHRYVASRAIELLGKPAAETKVVTCHLGNGSSISAVNGGKCMDTTMGFTPLAGLLMGTRSGDIDPAIVPYICERENMSLQDVNNYLNKKCGLLGISGVSSDMRYVEDAAAKGNERAQLALEMLEQQIVKYIGAYAAEMNGLDAVVFTAGIGENGISLRKAVCERLSFLGLDFDTAANEVRGKETEITKAGSKVKAFVIPTDEELMIARDTMAIVSK